MKRYFLMVFLVVFCLASTARAAVNVSQSDANHFMAVVNGLQFQLGEAANQLNTPEGVARFRDLAGILKLYSEVIGDFSSRSTSLFSKFLWASNPWINRNLILANGGSGQEEPLFPKMFEVLAQHTNIEIAASSELRAPLRRAAKSVVDSSTLEGVASQPPTATLVTKELELAVMLAALGVVTLPASLSTAMAQDPDATFPKYLAAPLHYFTYLLKNDASASARLKSLARTSRIAAIAWEVVNNPDFSGAAYRLHDFGVTGPTVERTQRAAFADATTAATTVDTAMDAYDSKPAPTPQSPPSPRSDLSANVPFISTSPFSKPAFDPRSSKDLALFSTETVYLLTLEMINFANDINEDLLFQEQRVTKALKVLGEGLRTINRWYEAGAEKNKAFVTLMVEVNPWIMHNFIELDVERSGTSQFGKLQKGLLTGDVTLTRHSALALRNRPHIPPVYGAREVAMDENDQIGALMVANLFIQMAPQILMREKRKARPIWDIGALSDRLAECFAVLGAYEQRISSGQLSRAIKGGAHYPEWAPHIAREIPIAKMAKKTDQLLTDLHSIRNQVLVEKDQVPQLVRLCMTGDIRRGQSDTCSHWDLIDAYLGLNALN